MEPDHPISPIRLAAIGCGRVFERFHLPAIRRNDARLVAAFEPASERRAWLQRAAPETQLLDSLDELTDVADAALITTPPASHAELTVTCLRAGVAVLVEKPLVTSLADALRVRDAAAMAERIAVVGYNRRCRNGYEAAKSLGTRTPPDHVVVRLATNPKAWGRPPEDLDAALLDDLGTHAVDLARLFLADEVTSVRALNRRSSRGHEAVLELTFPRGRSAVCRVAYGDRYDEWVALTIEGRTRLITPGGAVWRRNAPDENLHEPTWLRAKAQVTHALAKLTRSSSPTQRSFERQLERFIASVRSGAVQSPLASIDDGVAAVRVIDACRRSIDTGGREADMNESEQGAVGG